MYIILIAYELYIYVYITWVCGYLGVDPIGLDPIISQIPKGVHVWIFLFGFIWLTK